NARTRPIAVRSRIVVGAQGYRPARQPLNPGAHCMFANCQLMGMDLAFPDICKTPPALIPIPYPNFALGPMGIPNAWNILLMGMPAHNLATTIVMTNGDNPGLAL